MTEHKTQLERVRGRLHQVGHITRNQCLSQRPAITRLAARIDDLEREGYAFTERKERGDYRYDLVSINGVPFKREQQYNRPEDLDIAREAVRAFDALSN
jgi:hypothetical protein